MKIDKLNNVMILSETYSEGKKNCQRTSCGEIATHEVGVMVSGEEYYWNLCKDCYNELDSGMNKGWKKREGRTYYLDNEPMFYLARVELDNSNHNMSPTELDAVANWLEEQLQDMNLEESHKKHLEG